MELNHSNRKQLPKVVAISGKYGTGKDTAAVMIAELVHLHDETITIKHHKFADALKRLTAELSDTSVTDHFSEKGKEKMLPDPLCTFEQFVAKLNVVIINHIPHKISYGYKTKLITIAKKLVKSDPNHPGMVTFGYTIGRMQQLVGTIFREEIRYDLWVAIVMDDIDKCGGVEGLSNSSSPDKPTSTVHIISDCRFKNEANEVKRRGRDGHKIEQENRHPGWERSNTYF